MQQRVIDHYLDPKERPALTGHLATRVQDFAHPREVVADQELNPMEKRAILAAWASDISAVESHPEFRWLSGTPGPVPFSHILDGLRALDAETEREAVIISAMGAREPGRGASS
jgi:hypothetical protein